MILLEICQSSVKCSIGATSFFVRAVMRVLHFDASTGVGGEADVFVGAETVDAFDKSDCAD